MAERVFKPAGMSRSTLRPLMAMTWPLAQGHSPGSEKPVIIRPAADNTANWPAGSVFSNAEEMARFAIALMNDGRVDGKQALPAKLTALLTSPQEKTPEPGVNWGYGLRLGRDRGVRWIEHGGARAGYGSLVRIAPDQRVAVVVITNRSGATLPKTAARIFEALVPMEPAKTGETAEIPMTPEEVSRYVAPPGPALPHASEEDEPGMTPEKPAEGRWASLSRYVDRRRECQ